MKRYAPWLVLLSLPACVDTTEESAGSAQSGTKTGNGITLEFGTTGQQLRLLGDAGVADAGPVVGQLPNPAQPDVSLHLDVATMRVSQIDVLPATTIDCSAPVPEGSGAECLSDRYRISDVVDLDLITGESIPSLDDYRLPAGDYERVEISLALPSPDTPQGSSALHIAGVVEVAGGSVPFQFELTETRVLEFVARTSAVVEVQDGERLRASFDVARLFERSSAGCLDFGLTVNVGTEDVCESSGDELLDALRASTELSGNGD
jgi:hypothetical protein